MLYLVDSHTSKEVEIPKIPKVWMETDKGTTRKRGRIPLCLPLNLRISCMHDASNRSRSNVTSSVGERPWTFCNIKWKGSLRCTCWVCGHQLPCGVISKGSLGCTHSVPIEPQIVFAEAVSFLVLLDTTLLVIFPSALSFSFILSRSSTRTEYIRICIAGILLRLYRDWHVCLRGLGDFNPSFSPG